jgi:hypothetical protein
MNIIPESQYEKIFTGSKITAQHLKLVLEEAGISSIERDDAESALRGGYVAAFDNDTKLFVNKKDILKAKHIVSTTLENEDKDKLSDDEFAKIAEQKDDVISISSSKNTHKKETYRRSPFNLILNVLIVLYSMWRLSPLLRGETLSTLRIVVSSSLILFCSWAIVHHFRQKNV